MKILYVASKYEYGIQSRGFSFEHYNFYDTLVGMGHEVEYFDFFGLFHQHGREGMSRLLLEAVDRIRPELMFTFLFSEQFDPSVLRKITSERRAVTFNWFADDHWRFENFSRHWAPCFSFVSTTEAAAVQKYKASGYHNVLLTQWGANPRIYIRKQIPRTCDVTFVGQSYGDRPATILALRRAGIAVNVWGAHWNLRWWHNVGRRLKVISANRYQQITDSTRVTQEKMIDIFCTSRINLNLSAASQGGEPQIKGRNFEIPACGGFQLSGRAERLDEYFVPGKEIVCFSTPGELIEKARYYLGHEDERAAIAAAGHTRVIRDHTYESRFRELFHKMHLD